MGATGCLLDTELQQGGAPPWEASAREDGYSARLLGLKGLKAEAQPFGVIDRNPGTTARNLKKNRSHHPLHTIQLPCPPQCPGLH